MSVNYDASDLATAFGYSTEEEFQKVIETIRSEFLRVIFPGLVQKVKVLDGIVVDDLEKGIPLGEVLSEKHYTKVTHQVRSSLLLTGFGEFEEVVYTAKRIREKLPEVPSELLWLVIGDRHLLSELVAKADNIINNIYIRVQMIRQGAEEWEQPLLLDSLREVIREEIPGLPEMVPEFLNLEQY